MTARRCNSVAPATCFFKDRAVVSLALGVALLPLFCICLDLGLRARGQEREAAAWMARLDLSAPALPFADTAMRHLQTALPAVDPRFGPFFATRPSSSASSGDHGAAKP